MCKLLVSAGAAGAARPSMVAGNRAVEELINAEEERVLTMQVS